MNFWLNILQDSSNGTCESNFLADVSARRWVENLDLLRVIHIACKWRSRYALAAILHLDEVRSDHLGSELKVVDASVL